MSLCLVLRSCVHQAGRPWLLRSCAVTGSHQALWTLSSPPHSSSSSSLPQLPPSSPACRLRLSTHLAASLRPQRAALSTKIQLPSDSKLVYRMSSERFVFGTLCLFNICIPMLVTELSYVGFNMWNEPWTMDTWMANAITRSFVLTCFYIPYLVLLHKMVMKIYYSEELQEFYLERITWNMGRRVVKCRPGEAKKVAITFTGTLMGNIMIDGKTYMVNDMNFTSPMHYNVMLGTVEPPEKGTSRR